MNKAIPFDPNLILALVASNTSGSNDEQLRDIYGDLRQRVRDTNGDPYPRFEELWCSELIAESMAIRALAKSSQLFSEGKAMAALETLEGIAFLDKSPWTAEVLNNLAVLNYELGNKPEAMKLINLASQLAPKDILIKGNTKFLSSEEVATQGNSGIRHEFDNIAPTAANSTCVDAPDEIDVSNDDTSEETLKYFFSLDQLQAPGPYPPGIDARRREDYLSDEDFENVFEMSIEAFKEIPKWRQIQLKKLAKLF